MGVSINQILLIDVAYACINAVRIVGSYKTICSNNCLTQVPGNPYRNILDLSNELIQCSGRSIDIQSWDLCNLLSQKLVHIIYQKGS